MQRNQNILEGHFCLEETKHKPVPLEEMKKLKLRYFNGDDRVEN